MNGFTDDRDYLHRDGRSYEPYKDMVNKGVPSADIVRKARLDAALSGQGEIMSAISRQLDYKMKHPESEASIVIDVSKYSKDVIEGVITSMGMLGYTAVHKSGNDFRDGPWSQITIKF